jgi:hypothetical protein
MNKPLCTFCFADEPQYAAANELRSYIANSFRAYRKNKRYTLVKLAPGIYKASLNYPGAPVAIITTR